MYIYNSLTKKKEAFLPLDKKNVKMYVCGITPYDTTHLGHAFTYVFFDVLKRYLEFKGNKVTYTQNVTDIDDDILKRAAKEGRNWQELGNFWTNRFLTDLESLNVKIPDFYVKATDSIPKIIEITDKLLKEGFAYENNGNIYFDVTGFKDYGKLSKYDEKKMMSLLDERGGNSEDKNKRNPLDFILWLKSKQNEPSWKGPLNIQGRPGWHIECSAMINQYLGDQIDIHGGGHDLIFPHHESEIAQSESFTGKKPFVKFWMHTAILRYQSDKMSKSLGNLVMISDLIKKYSANAIRWVLLSHHYRENWEFYEQELIKAEKIIDSLHKNLNKGAENITGHFLKSMENDMDTPNALKLIQSSRSKILLEVLGFRN